MPDGPIALLELTWLDDGYVGALGVNAYGRYLTAVVPWEWSTNAGIELALRFAWAQQLEAELDRLGALASWAAETREDALAG